MFELLSLVKKLGKNKNQYNCSVNLTLDQAI